MSRFFLLLGAVTGLSTLVTTGFAAEPTLAQEVHEMRRDMQLQSRQIETLTQQLAKLTQLLEAREAARVKLEPGSPAPIVVAPTAQPATEAVPEIPKAEAVAPLPQHVVAKGETLTSIAKTYNITITELQKLNKITNERKLQIGQSLSIPVSKTPEPPAEKKENP